MITISHLGAGGDLATVKVVEPDKTTTLCACTLASTDTTIALACTAIAAAINALTYSHGYTAVASTTTVTITAPKKLGKFLNTNTPLSITIVQTGGLAGSVTTPFAGGAASLLAQWNYHITEYYRLNPNGNLWVYFAPITGNAWNFQEIQTLQGSGGANGAMRQAGVYLGNCGAGGSGSGTAAWIKTVADACQAVKVTLDGYHMPVSIIIGTDISAISDLTTLTDASTWTDFGVSAILSQGGWINSTLNPVTDPGWLIYKGQGYSITDIGAKLGTISLSPVNDDQGWVSKYNLTDGINLAVPAFGNGHNIDLIAVSNLLALLDRYRYIYNGSYVGLSGVFQNDNPCLISAASSFAWINNNRVFDKAARLLYLEFLPLLNGDVDVNTDGTPTSLSLSIWQSMISNALAPMTSLQPGQATTEIAGYTATINPNQNIVTSGKIVIGLHLGLQGIASSIIIILSNN